MVHAPWLMLLMHSYLCVCTYNIDNISATVPAGHQGSVSNENTSCQLPVAGASPGEIADFLISFKGPHGTNPGITRNQV